MKERKRAVAVSWTIPGVGQRQARRHGAGFGGGGGRLEPRGASGSGGRGGCGTELGGHGSREGQASGLSFGGVSLPLWRKQGRFPGCLVTASVQSANVNHQRLSLLLGL